MVKLVDAIHTALVQGRGYYHPVFEKVLKLDYMSVALETICKRLADDLMDILPKVNKEILLEPGWFTALHSPNGPDCRQRL